MDSPFHEIINFLYLGNAQSVKARKFNMIVNCTKEDEIAFPTYYEPLCMRLSIRDDPAEANSLVQQINDSHVLEQIDFYLKNKQSVLVHCFMGMQRSCAVVACYLVRYYNSTPAQAIAYIKSKRPIAFLGNVNLLAAIENYYDHYVKPITLA